MGTSKQAPKIVSTATSAAAAKPPKVVKQNPYANEPGHAIDSNNPKCTK